MALPRICNGIRAAPRGLRQSISFNLLRKSVYVNCREKVRLTYSIMIMIVFNIIRKYSRAVRPSLPEGIRHSKLFFI